MNNEFTYKNGGNAQHMWYHTGGEPTVFNWSAEGWRIEEDGGRFEVYYHTNEAMRLGADGSFGVGQPEGYWFNTREWAELCVRRLTILDQAFGKNTAAFTLSTSGNIGIGFASPMMKLEVRGSKFEPLVSVDQGGHVTQVNMPALLGIWWRGTRAYRAWRKLMWGEKYADGNS